MFFTLPYSCLQNFRDWFGCGSSLCFPAGTFHVQGFDVQGMFFGVLLIASAAAIPLSILVLSSNENKVAAR